MVTMHKGRTAGTHWTSEATAKHYENFQKGQ